MNENLLICNKCGHVLITGIKISTESDIICIFGEGTSITCRVCGNKYVFGKKEMTENLMTDREIEKMDNCTLFGLRTNQDELKKNIENLILDILKGYLNGNMPSQDFSNYNYVDENQSVPSG